MNRTNNSELITKNLLGFTLVEILVVMAVLSIFGTLVVTIFSRTLTGSNKSQLIGVIKQNGQAVLDKIDKTARNADYVCVSTDNKTLVTVKDGINTRYRFIPSAPLSNPTSSGLIQQDNPTSNQGETTPDFMDRVCGNTSDMINPVVLTDTNAQTGVSVDCVAVNGAPDCGANPVFYRESSEGFMDQVTIKFDLRPGVRIPDAVSSQVGSITFQTTIQLR